MVDIAVIGGGPGGCAAGWEAARNGASVIIFERGVPREERQQPGADSTDAAGLLSYWFDIMDIRPDELPDDVIVRRLNGVRFYAGDQTVGLTKDRLERGYRVSDYCDDLGVVFDRVAMDNHLRDRARQAGARYRTESRVQGLVRDNEDWVVKLADESVRARQVILADGPGRTVTEPVLRRMLPDDRLDLAEKHAAFQEYRRLPADQIDPNKLHFYWGTVPGENAYAWIFPEREETMEVGVTLPMGRPDENAPAYSLVDDDVPSSNDYPKRLLQKLFPDRCIDETFELVESRGKNDGTEGYVISSGRPIESPVQFGLAIVGGAMGATSAFHEGGYHTAVATGRLSGRLAAQGRLQAYNEAWQRRIGPEVAANVATAELTAPFQPRDWEQLLETANRYREPRWLIRHLPRTLRYGGKYIDYKIRSLYYRYSGAYCSVRARDYHSPQ